MKAVDIVIMRFINPLTLGPVLYLQYLMQAEYFALTSVFGIPKL
jgi:hypothetical protein